MPVELCPFTVIVLNALLPFTDGHKAGFVTGRFLWKLNTSLSEVTTLFSERDGCLV